MTRLTNGSSPKVSNLSSEVKLRSSNLTSRNNTNRSSTLQEDLIRLISPDYISASSSDNGIETTEENVRDSEQILTPGPLAAPLYQHPPPPPTQQEMGRPIINNGAEPPSSELYSMRLSAIGSSSPKYISPQRQSWSTTDSETDRKSYQNPSGSIQGDSDTPSSNGFRSKSPLKHSFSATLYSEPRTPAGSSAPNGTFRVTPSISVANWVKDDLKTTSS